MKIFLEGSKFTISLSTPCPVNIRSAPFLVATDSILRGSFRKRFDIQHMDFCHCITNKLKSTATPLRSKRIYPRMKVIPSLFVGRSVGSRWLAASVIALLAIFFGSVTGAANDLFSSNVVTLTSSNWKEHVVDNPHMVLVNICRKGWGYCQLLQPWVITLCCNADGNFPQYISEFDSFCYIHLSHYFFSVSDSRHALLFFYPRICMFREWEKLAASVKGMVTIAYWDTQVSFRNQK